jgi:hypothetical protein
MKEPFAFGPDADPRGRALESWKEIAAFLDSEASRHTPPQDDRPIRALAPVSVAHESRVTPRMLWGALTGLLLAAAAIWLWPA